MLTTIFYFVLYLLVAGLFIYVCQWAINQAGLPEPMHRIANLVMVIIIFAVVGWCLLGILGGGGVPVPARLP